MRSGVHDLGVVLFLGGQCGGGRRESTELVGNRSTSRGGNWSGRAVSVLSHYCDSFSLLLSSFLSPFNLVYLLFLLGPAGTNVHIPPC